MLFNLARGINIEEGIYGKHTASATFVTVMWVTWYKEEDRISLGEE